MSEFQGKLLVCPKQVRPTLKSFKVRGVLNPAAVRLPNKKVLLYARVAETPYHNDVTFLAPRFSGKSGMKITIEKISRKRMEIGKEFSIVDYDIYRLPTLSHLRKIVLDRSGTRVERISQKPDFYGLKDDGDFGVEDPRITFFEDEKRFAMTYVSVSMKSGVSTSLAVSRNLKTWDRKGIIFRQQNKDVVLFPEKINGYYTALHRPEGTMIFDKPRIWISYSKDLQFWGKDKPLLEPRKKSWDELRIGCGAVPIKTEEGWLAIYHGVHLEDKEKPDSQKVYSTGAVLLSLSNPEKILARTPRDKPLFAPLIGEEKSGFTNKVVFSTAAIASLDSKNLLIYSGAADSSITVRKIGFKKLLNSLS